MNKRFFGDLLSPIATACILLLTQIGYACAQETRFFPSLGSQPFVRKPQGEEVKLYSVSAALIVSASDYANGTGWRTLPNTTPELDRVTTELVKHGFEVTRVFNPTASRLQLEMANFLGKYGERKEARLVFFFSGHGYTSSTNQMSYVVPVDAANPNTSYSGFMSRALALESFHTWVRQFSANHFLTVFDTCFSGAIFTTRSGSERPDPRPADFSERWRYLTDNAKKPVRQFIAAGGPKEELPAVSTFVPVFLEALAGGASINRDGYVTGKEIGLFVERVVSNLRAGKQNPASGVSRDAEFVFGDVVFQYGPSKSEPPLANATVRYADPVVAALVQRSVDVNWRVQRSTTFAEIGPELRRMFLATSRNPDYTAQVRGFVDQLLSGRPRYEVAASETKVPWYVLGIIHGLESGFSFARHLHNGDPLTDRTVTVPAGRPATGNPPFTWEESTIDLVNAAGWNQISDWSIERMLYAIERFNGFGYRRRELPSPYVWSGTDIYAKGRYVTDGTFNAEMVSRNVGAAAALKELVARGSIAL